MAIIRAIVWFIIFHVGIDFWIFPNYFIDSDNILDSFRPVLGVEVREDITDLRMWVLRVASAIAIFYGANEFLKEPENLENLVSGSGELWNEMYDWGQNKFMGTVDESQQIQVKKSARQIYAEAFMDDENPMFRTNTQFADFADDDAVREANEQYHAEQKLSAEAAARAKFDTILEEEEEADGAETTQGTASEEESATQEAEGGDDEEEDLLDKLTGNIDEDDEDDEEAKAAEAAAQAEAEAKAKAEAKAAAKAAAEAKAAEEAKAKAAAEAKAKAEAEAKSKAEAEAKAAQEKAAEEAKAKAEEEAKLEAERARKMEEEREEYERARAQADIEFERE